MSELVTQDLERELASREDYLCLDIDAVYQALALKDKEKALQIVSDFIQEKTGRIVP
jgi:hypothetical protein